VDECEPLPRGCDGVRHCDMYLATRTGEPRTSQEGRCNYKQAFDRARSMTYLHGDCSYRRAAEEGGGNCKVRVVLRV